MNNFPVLKSIRFIISMKDIQDNAIGEICCDVGNYISMTTTTIYPCNCQGEFSKFWFDRQSGKCTPMRVIVKKFLPAASGNIHIPQETLYILFS